MDRLWPEVERESPIGLAVSGGPDSLALLLLAAKCLPLDKIAVLSVDHGLRAEAAEEVAFVEQICGEIGVAFTAKRVSVAQGNLQAKAREARYDALREWAEKQELGAIATAHHADDQAETFLMRLARGSGLSGLAGVRARGVLPGSNFPLIRPLLGVRKSELEALVAACGIVPVHDPSNTDPAFDRVRMRRILAEQDWLNSNNIAASAQHLAEGLEVIAYYAEREWREAVSQEIGDDGLPVFTYRPTAPRLIRIEVLMRIISRFDAKPIRSEVGRAVDRLDAEKNASISGVLVRFRHQKDSANPLWIASREPPRKTR